MARRKMTYMHPESQWSTSCSIQLEKTPEAGFEKSFTVKLQEFGHAAKTEDVADAGKISVPSHAAPEVFGKNQISKATDVYAFGMLWWEIVMGQLLWPSLNAEQVQKKVASKQMPSLPQEYDAGIKGLLESCIAFKPAQRPTFNQIVSRLSAMQTECSQNKPLLGHGEEATAAQPAVRRLFNTRGTTEGRKTSMDVRPKLDTIPAASSKEVEKPTMLEKASADTADAQKKSMFKRFAQKFKT